MDLLPYIPLALVTIIFILIIYGPDLILYLLKKHLTNVNKLIEHNSKTLRKCTHVDWQREIKRVQDKPYLLELPNGSFLYNPFDLSRKIVKIREEGVEETLLLCDHMEIFFGPAYSKFRRNATKFIKEINTAQEENGKIANIIQFN